MTTEVKQAIEKLTVATDIVKEVEATTEKHYSLNQRFTVTRDGKEYFISIKKIDVNGQVIKSHIRLDIDTDLPIISKLKNIDFERITKIEKRILKASKVVEDIKSFSPDKYNNFVEYRMAINEIQKNEKLIKKLKGLE